jgi:hypothetical protein
MTLVLESAETGAIALDEFLDHAEHDLHVCDTESLAQAAPAFKRLLNNRSLLRDYIDSELRNWRDGNSDHEYFNHTLVMARRANFFVRANIWIAPNPALPAPTRDDPSFGYLYPHDHNFAFITGGYYGPGYTTCLFDYDQERVAGMPGERLEIVPRGTSTLELGSMMLYEPSRDIHYQQHPPQLSISLNVIVPAHYTDRAQYLFDIERGEIDVVLAAASARGVTVCALAAELGDENTMELVSDLMHWPGADPRLRIAAAQALGEAAIEELRSTSDRRIRGLISSRADSDLEPA